MIAADVLLRSLVGEALTTIRAQPNTVLSVDADEALVATSRSPQGQPVPVAWLQSVLDRLAAGETVPIEPGSVGYRSAFLGAVLRTLPQVEIQDGSPPSARVDPAADVSASVLVELERRLGMWAELSMKGDQRASRPPYYGRSRSTAARAACGPTPRAPAASAALTA